MSNELFEAIIFYGLPCALIGIGISVVLPHVLMALFIMIAHVLMALYIMITYPVGVVIDAFQTLSKYLERLVKPERER